MKRFRVYSAAARVSFGLIAVALLVLLLVPQSHSDVVARDPGVRGGAAAAGGAIPGLNVNEVNFFQAGKVDFEEEEGVGDGLGPRFNLDSCVGCHSQPASGGSSPAINPQVSVATAFGARNTPPSFIAPNGPVREARLKFNADGTRDGGVHALFVISGRIDSTGNAGGCQLMQEDFAPHIANNNVIFRIPTPVFGAGLIEAIPDSAIRANAMANTAQKSALGIFGRFNRVSGNPNNNGNDGTIARFGWKAQNKSALLFAGEAYNVEMGITNELFQTERDETANCQFAAVPNDVTDVNAAAGPTAVSAIERFAFFMRFLAPPAPSSNSPGGALSIARGRAVFADVGCALCHTPSFTTGNSSIAALRNKRVNLYSDLALHAMGPRLADEIIQGEARGDEFRTAPLWGLGQRIFFLHDGRTTDLKEAIRAHKSVGNLRFAPSEANAVVDNFNGLSEPSKQDLLNFLRSL